MKYDYIKEFLQSIGEDGYYNISNDYYTPSLKFINQSEENNIINKLVKEYAYYHDKPFFVNKEDKITIYKLNKSHSDNIDKHIRKASINLKTNFIQNALNGIEINLNSMTQRPTEKNRYHYELSNQNGENISIYHTKKRLCVEFCGINKVMKFFTYPKITSSYCYSGTTHVSINELYAKNSVYGCVLEEEGYYLFGTELEDGINPVFTIDFYDREIINQICYSQETKESEELTTLKTNLLNSKVEHLKRDFQNASIMPTDKTVIRCAYNEHMSLAKQCYANIYSVLDQYLYNNMQQR